MKINLDFIYPIGSIYETTSVIHPNVSLGGKWELYGAGRVTVCIDENDSDNQFATIGETGGSKYLQGHKHSTSWSVTGTGGKGQGYDGMPFYRAGNLTNDSQLMWTGYRGGVSDSSGMKDLSNNQISVGNSGNLQPYIVVYRYRRIA